MVATPDATGGIVAFPDMKKALPFSLAGLFGKRYGAIGRTGAGCSMPGIAGGASDAGAVIDGTAGCATGDCAVDEPRAAVTSGSILFSTGGTK